MTKGIIYEVQLIDWVERVDIEANGNLIKTYIQKPVKKEWERPTDIDDVNFSLKVFYKATPDQGEDEPEVLYELQNLQTTMSDERILLTFRKILESMKRGEHSVTEVK